MFAVVGSAASGPVDLAWVPRKGDRAVVELTVEARKGGEATAAWTRAEAQVVSVEADGSYRVRTRNQEATLALHGELVRDERKNERLTRYSRRGEMVAIEKGEASAQAYRAGLLSRFVRPEGPVEVGGQWTTTWTPPVGLDLPALRTVYTLRAVEGDVRVVAFEAVETGGSNPAKATGTWRLSSQGVAGSMEAKVENYLGIPGLTATVTWRRL